MLKTDARGLLNYRGGFYIDPWQPVDCAVITHAHADHAREGMKRYICHKSSAGILRKRLGEDSHITALAYEDVLDIGGVKVSLHAAGHILGSAQVRMESAGQVWVVSGDYKRDADETCAAFTPVECDVFVSEATFALPVFQWPGHEMITDDILTWWQSGIRDSRTSFLFAYSLGKAQRILTMLSQVNLPGPLYLHTASAHITKLYEEEGIRFPPYTVMDNEHLPTADALVIAPPGVFESKLVRSFKNASQAQASGWMQLRGIRRRRGYETGFALSDHADWPSLLRTIAQSRARQIYLTHGYTDVLARYLREKGFNAQELKTLYGGDQVE